MPSLEWMKGMIRQPWEGREIVVDLMLQYYLTPGQETPFILFVISRVWESVWRALLHDPGDLGVPPPMSLLGDSSVWEPAAFPGK